MSEKYWQDENDPSELLRRAEDLRREGHLAMAEQLLFRARQLCPEKEPSGDTE